MKKFAFGRSIPANRELVVLAVQPPAVCFPCVDVTWIRKDRWTVHATLLSMGDVRLRKMKWDRCIQCGREFDWRICCRAAHWSEGPLPFPMRTAPGWLRYLSLLPCRRRGGWRSCKLNQELLPSELGPFFKTHNRRCICLTNSQMPRRPSPIASTCRDLKRMASKWERAFSTQNGGQSVNVVSRYISLQSCCLETDVLFHRRRARSVAWQRKHRVFRTRVVSVK